MSRILFTAFIGWLAGSVALSAAAEDQTFECLNIQNKADRNVSGYFPNEPDLIKGQGLLPRGKHLFGGVQFDVGQKLIQLCGRQKRARNNNEKTEGIAVGTTANHLHFLHSTHGGTVLEDETISRFVVNYDDKSQATIDIVYGRDVLNWYYIPECRELKGGKMVWTGLNPRAATQGLSVSVYLTTWKNPTPAKRIATIDYISTMTDCEPFCIAISLDRK